MQLPQIDRYKAVKVGGQQSSTTRSDLLVDIASTTRDDIEHLLKQITIQELAKQERMGNQANRIIVDNRDRANIANARYKTEVIFGDFLPRAAMALTEQVLAREIKRQTTKRTGRLSDIRSNWRWVLIQNRKRKSLGGPQDIKTFGFRDRLIIAPTVAYAGIVNSLVARRSGVGFLKTAATKLSRNSRLKSLSFTAGFSQRFTAPGEIYKHGTPFIMIKGERNRGRRR